MCALPMPPSTALLDQILLGVPRPYRLPAMAVSAAEVQEANPAATLAIAIEQARVAVAGKAAPDAALKHRFLEALACLIRDAVHSERGDPAFQAIVLRHRAVQVREYASLSARAAQDRRRVSSLVNAIAHPAKQQRVPPGRQRAALAELHEFASTESWTGLAATAQAALGLPEIANETRLKRGLAQLPDDPALTRLLRLHALTSDKLVQRYQSLWSRQGPYPGSPMAALQGAASQQRGAAVEALAAQALEALARRLNDAEGTSAPYRVVTSMLVPASIPASPERAKSEWDSVLLKKADTLDGTPAWDVCLLVEAKASVDAAASDLPRLLRGLRLLGHADDKTIYSFQTRQGQVPLRGASLRALRHSAENPATRVLYCCDASADTAPRLLGAASRMQLLSASASVEFAVALAEEGRIDPPGLEPVWDQLLKAARWKAVLDQYTTLRQARELMVHPQDLLDTIQSPNVI
jgi:hypothetical protein